jgi:hypothetical protein
MIFSSSPQLSPDLLTHGGLDHLWDLRYILEREGYFPPGFRSHIVRGILGGKVPMNELIIAYGAVINRAQDEFLRQARGRGLDVDVLTTQSMRAWTQMFFQGPSSRSFGEWVSRGRVGRQFGGFTALTLAQKLVREGRATNLNDVLMQPELRGDAGDRERGYDIAQRGLLSGAEAEMIGETLGTNRIPVMIELD